MATFVTTIKIISVLRVLAAQRVHYTHIFYATPFFAKETRYGTGVFAKNEKQNSLQRDRALKIFTFQNIKRRGVADKSEGTPVKCKKPTSARK